MKIITKKQKLIIYTIVFFSLMFNLCYIHSSLVKKNKNNAVLHKYRKASNSLIINYTSELNNIIFQSNALRNAITWNNTIINKYKNLFSYNIIFESVQKNIICSKIRTANFSIIHELKSLNNMKNIIYNHQFDYLKLFQIHNYSIPLIFLHSNKNDLNKINNIETYSRKIQNTS